MKTDYEFDLKVMPYLKTAARGAGKLAATTGHWTGFGAVLLIERLSFGLSLCASFAHLQLDKLRTLTDPRNKANEDGASETDVQPSRASDPEQEEELEVPSSVRIEEGAVSEQQADSVPYKEDVCIPLQH